MIVVMLCTAEDPNIAGYVARREARGFPPVESGTMYDIISKICDHELAQVITQKMLKHEASKTKEKESEKANEEGGEEQAPPHSSPQKRSRQSLGEYYIQHPPPPYQPFAQEEEEQVIEENASENQPDEDMPHMPHQDQVTCSVLTCDVAMSFPNGSMQDASNKQTPNKRKGKDLQQKATPKTRRKAADPKKASTNGAPPQNSPRLDKEIPVSRSVFLIMLK